MNRRALFTGGAALVGHHLFPQVLAAFLSEARASEAPALRFVTEPEMRTLQALVDVILPATDSPAASTALTHHFVDVAADACATPEQKQILRGGLRDLDDQSWARFRRPYAEITPARQAALLTPRAEADSALPYEASFFKLLKDYTLTGYFHSEIGATQALAYEQIPGGYEGDIPLTPDQKAWAI